MSITHTEFEVNGIVDWNALEQARINAGESCYSCRRFVLFGGPGRSLCGSCKSIRDDSGEITHHSSFRCPYCHHTSTVSDSEQYELYEEGEHEVGCSNCNKDFTVSTAIQYTFTSPALGESGGDEDRDEE